MTGPPQFIPLWFSQTSQRDSLRLNTTACLGDTTTLKLTLNSLPLVNVCFHLPVTFDKLSLSLVFIWKLLNSYIIYKIYYKIELFYAIICVTAFSLLCIIWIDFSLDVWEQLHRMKLQSCVKQPQIHCKASLRINSKQWKRGVYMQLFK